MDFEKLMKDLLNPQSTSLFGAMEQLLASNEQKPPVIVTDRYIREEYSASDVVVGQPAPAAAAPAVIDLRNQNLRQIPDWVFDYREVEGLLLDHNPDLRALPERLAELPRLKVLGLQRTLLTSFYPIAQLLHLESLDISGNNLDAWPEEVCQLSSLIYLDISTYNRFTIVPDSVTRLSQLRVLRAHYNKISVLPHSIGELAHLEQLILGANALTSVPDSLYELTNLKELDLFDNQITSLDLQALSQLEHLDEIYLAGNPVEGFPPELIAQSKGVISSLALRKYFSTGVYFEISRSRSNEGFQRERLARSARALLIRGIYSLCTDDVDLATQLLSSGYELASDLQHNKLVIMAAFFLQAAPQLGTSEGALQRERMEKAAALHEFPLYERQFGRAVSRISTLSADLPAAENDFEFVLEHVFLGDFDLIRLSDSDSLAHTMITHVSQSHSDARSEMNNRDLLRGLIEVGLFDCAWSEVARQHCTTGVVAPLDQLIPKNANEAFICVMQLTNRDKLRILVNRKDAELQVIELDSISISLNAITTDAMIQELDSPIPLAGLLSNTPVDVQIWNALFGANIASVQSSSGVSDWTETPTTFYEYCQEYGISKLAIAPVASMHGIPLYCGYDRKANRRVVDDFELVHRPPFVPVRPPAAAPRYNASFIVHLDLPFAQAEAELIGNLFESKTVIRGGCATEALETFERSRLLHFSCHAGDSKIRFGDKDAEIVLHADEIRRLNLSACELAFLNACRTAEDPRVSLINVNSLVLAFLEAGAHAVISTSQKVSDSEAFRIGVRFHQLSKNKTEYGGVLRNLLLEGFKGTLPWFDHELTDAGHFELGAGLAAQKELADALGRRSWECYSMWQNNVIDQR